MGNCLVMQDKVIKVVKTDGKVLEYRAPIKAHQVLSDFSGHAISDTHPATRHLQPDSELAGGRVYYLLTLPAAPPAAAPEKKRVRFAVPAKDGGRQGTGVVRIKLVISKKELEAMLRNGAFSVDDMVSDLQKKQSTDDQKNTNSGDGAWKPVLESIPEVN
ncbi:hypothetical protein NMG60_11008459 [Bertholletia excelsa]